MAGTYHGGSTLIGPGMPWPTEPPFDPPAQTPSLPQSELLRALGFPKATMRKRGGQILKELVAGGVLLDSGQPNVNHPTVIAIIKARKAPAKPKP